MGKRANGEGTMSRRKDRNGRTVGWRAAVTVGVKADGTPDRRWVSGKTQEEVRELLRQLVTAHHTGMLANAESMTVAEYLARWLEHKQRDLKPNTLRSYRNTVRLYIEPNVGKIRLDKLRPLDVDRFVNALLRSGQSPAMAAYALRVLRMALRQAVVWEMLPRNVTDGVKPPRVRRPELTVWTPAEAARFLQVASSHRLYGAFYLALMTGLRRGEVLGLHWSDIDEERRRLKVRHNLVDTQEGLLLDTPKTEASRRSVVLSPGTLDVLQAHRQRQAVERAALGRAYPAHDIVFASEVGTFTDPRNLERAYYSLILKAGVPRIRFHDLRHTAASLLIHKGVPPKVVSDQLGHTDVAFTLRVYAHLYDEQREVAALDWSDLKPARAPSN